MSDETKTEAIEPEILEEDLAKPGTPISADALALLAPGRGEAIILQRAQILATTRASHIRSTFPNDWTLFKTEEGQEYGYLADQGCQRGRRLWGISLTNLGPLGADPYYEWRQNGERVVYPRDDESYSCRLTADGAVDLTKDQYLNLEGFGYSDDPDAQQVPAGDKRKDRVSNHARRNLEGRLIRRTGGLEAVPIEEIARCWEGTTKKVALCNKGRGYGTARERAGGASEKHGVDYADIPMCDVCQIKLVYRPAKDNRAAFWGCSGYAKHPETKIFVDHARLLADIQKRKNAE